MIRCLRTILALILLATVARADPSSRPTTAASRPTGEFTGYPSGPADLRTPGFHKLMYRWMEGDQTRRASFSIYLPQGYGEDGRRWPMLTFLAGLGDRGADPGNAMAVGVPLEIGRSPELSGWMPMIVLSPQCPGDKVWDTPGMAQVTLRLIHEVIDQFAVDTTRLYLTGFSDGGKGCWALASAEPNLFVVSAPVVSREYLADETAGRLAGNGITCLVISGMKDPKSEPASAHMVAALRQRSIDVVYAPIPDAEHFIWRAFYSQKEFYQWLLLHRRGEAVPANRLGGDQFVSLFTSRQQLSLPQQLFEHRMQRGLDRFEPYWFADNCADAPGVGLQPRLQERKNVFVSRPVSADIPCRLQTTRQLPKDKQVDLVIEVGHPPKGEWELVVRVNEQEQLRTLVNDQTAPEGWLELKVSLRAFAGKEARLQLIQTATQMPGTAYWAKVKLVETPP